jgi:peptide/nickel transport system substrate-binding protein
MKNEKEDFGGLTRREFLALSGAGMAGMTLAGIPELVHAKEEKPKYGGILRVGYRWGSTGLDAHKNQDFADAMAYRLMYEGITEQGKLPEVEIYPMLAKSWEISNDGREYIFPLREGIKFHHGKEFDSSDVKYSIERVMNPATRAPKAYAFRMIDSVQVIDKYTVKFKLKEPFAPLLSTLTIHTCPIIPAGWEPTATKPAPGTGAFAFKSFVVNESFEASRFDKYHMVDEKTGDRLPYLDGVHVRKIVDDTVRLTALRAGDIDYCAAPPNSVLAKAILEKPIPGVVMDYIVVGNHMIWFNLTKPPFDNKKVRQAIAYAIDKKEMVKAIFWGLGETINDQPFLKESRFYIPVQDREVDLAKAKQLLAEAGYPNGFKTELFEFSMGVYLAGAEVVIGQLKKIGIEATMKVIDRAPYYSMMRKGDYNISFGDYDERFDWDDAFYMYFHSGEIGKNNYTGYRNKELDALLEKGRATWRTEERRPIYKQVIDILKEDLPALYISKSVTGNAFRDYLKGFRKGFGSRFSWYGGGAKYWWLDK